MNRVSRRIRDKPPLVYLGTSGVRYLTEGEVAAWYATVQAIWRKRVPAKAQRILLSGINRQPSQDEPTP